MVNQIGGRVRNQVWIEGMVNQVGCRVRNQVWNQMFDIKSQIHSQALIQVLELNQVVVDIRILNQILE